MGDRIKRLEEIAVRLRLSAVRALYKAQSGHPGAALSCADLVAALLFDEMKFTETGRDRFILSKGHGVAVLYAAFAELGWISKSELDTLRKLGGRLQGHPDMTRLSYLDAGTGALGQGLSITIGYALAARLSASKCRTYCIVGDGECQEGQVWEAAMYASAHKLDNLVAIIDCNGFQNEGSIEETLPIEPLAKKWRSFGWHAIEIDGHDFRQILNALDKARATRGKPSVIVARTIKGKGVGFMENNSMWHSRIISDAEYKDAIKSLKQVHQAP